MQRGLTVLRDLIIGDRVFQIPAYQRNYSWEEPQWKDLWNDLSFLAEGKKHYYGTLLIRITMDRKEAGLKSFEVQEIVDGQQRIVTSLILIREIISRLEQFDGADTQEEINRLREDYLTYRGIQKVQLLGDDRDFFGRHIVEGIDYPRELLTPSQRRLTGARDFFAKKMEEVKATQSQDDYRAFLLDLKSKIDNLEVIRYEVENSADAVLVFETVNDRGKVLTNMEKTKSFLMHAVYLSCSEEPSEYLARINNEFANMYRWFETINNTAQGKDLREDDVQRYHFIIHEAVPGDRRTVSYQYMQLLKEKIRDMYRSNKERCLPYTIGYTDDLEKAFFTMKEIISYQGNSGVGDLLSRIFTLERVANFYPLLIAGWEKWSTNSSNLKLLLAIIEKIAFRVFAIGRTRSDAGEGWLYDLSYRVHSGELNHDELLNELRDFVNYYEDDTKFQGDLRLDNFYTRVSNRDIKYLLFEYEAFLRRRARELLDIQLGNILSPNFEIEHIWARDPSQLNLPESVMEIHNRFKDRLGNLTLASEQWNKHWGPKPFKLKRREYEQSILRVQRELADFDKWGSRWGKGKIEDRENQLIEFALDRWRV